MKPIFTRDEIINGYNDRCQVIPARRQDHAYKVQLARLMLSHMAKAARSGSRTKAVLEAKVDRAVELAERVAARERALPRLEGPDTTLLPSAGQVAAQMRRDYEANMERRCAESAAAYAARNPHSKEGR